MTTPDNAPVWDTLITDALVFDGSGSEPLRIDVALADGKIAAKGTGLPHHLAREVRERPDRWLMPGLLDIHTHLDLEVEIAPGLSEVVRHGTTTVLVGNCSLGTAFGAQRLGDQDPIVDCFARVENIPKHVLRKCVERMDWDNTADYLAHLDALALGPNMAPLVPHSMLRVQVMGLEPSISREPTRAELDAMCTLLQDAIDQGYIGFSTDNLPFHYLANDPHRDQRIPTQFASYTEIKRLTGLLRAAERVWQATPMPDDRIGTLRRFLLSSGRLFGKPLRLSALAAVDFAANPRGSRALLGIARALNSSLLRGNCHLQALSSPFTMWADGVTIPIMEEMESSSRLMALELDDCDGRRRLLEDPDFVRQFRADWNHGKHGFNRARLMTLAGMPADNFSRELADMVVDRCPVASWAGQTLEQIYRRLLRFQSTRGNGAANDEEAEFFSTFPDPIGDDVDFLLHILRRWDKQFRWFTVVANRDRERIRELLFDSATLPGFNDSGAHLTNLAFYDGNLLTLKIAYDESLSKVALAVRRLTREPAEFFGIDAGSLEIGARADVAIIDPEALRAYDSDAGRQLVYREEFENEQLVNRSDGVVTDVFIAGRAAWENGACTSTLGSERLGRALRYSGRTH